MEYSVTTENVLSALLLMGYTNISHVFYSVLVTKLYYNKKCVIVEDKEFSEIFKYCTVIDQEGFHLKKNCNLSTNIASVLDLNRRYLIFLDYINTEDNIKLMEHMKKNISFIEVEKEEELLLPSKKRKYKVKK